MSKTETVSFQELLRETTNFFVQLLVSIKNGIVKFWIYSLVLLMIVGGLYFFQFRKTHTFYKAKASYTFNFTHKKVFGDLILYTSELNSNNEKKTLAKVLKIPVKTATSLLSINAKNITSGPLHEDFTDARVPFYLHIEVSDLRKIPELQNALTNYLNQDLTTNRFVVKEIARIREELSFVENEIEYLDSLRANLGDDQKMNLSMILNKSQNYSNEKIHLNNRLSDLHPVTLLEPFKPILVPRSSQLKNMAVKYFISWLLISLSITTFLYWYKNVGDEI